LHANACEDPRPEGIEIYHAADGNVEPAPGSTFLAHAITDALRARFVRVRGHPRMGAFTVLSANSAPSVLVELGYLTHDAESARLRDPHYQELVTDALVDGIGAYLQATEQTRIAARHTPG
jgi:N-acetylmuramoyl-L-alanine amidase